MSQKADFSQKLFLFEINEFNYELLQDMVEKLNLSHLKKLIKTQSAQHSISFIPDHYDSGFLEPWCQWVSIHTGQPSSVHKIKHLGDVPNLGENQQLWEALSNQGYSVGVWGVMNGSRGQAKNCRFFMPDPWTFSEDGYPGKIAQLLKLPRYISKNYLKPSIAQAVKLIPSFLSGLTIVPLDRQLIKEFFYTLKNSFKYKSAHFVWISFFDYLTTKAFIHLAKKHETQVNIFFINSIAHAQHHYWDNKTMDRLEYTYKYLDRIVGLLDENQFFSSKFIITNGLTQKNTNEEIPWILYRQNNPTDFFKSLNLGITKVEQLMTNDSHLFFDNNKSCAKAFEILSKTQINGKNLFYCEKDSSDEKKIFVRLDFFDIIEKDVQISINNVSFWFLQSFTAIVRRTGKHIQRADVISNAVQMQPEEMNYSLFNKTLRAL
ncbi:hypothetical protein [Pseudobdellovibrio sp. HCB154]|uniref:hypothetical protein n=1 Tax=Pseudobdellovibrio sp. HCB154 TaxID=3386277 RepID=UPI00391729F1